MIFLASVINMFLYRLGGMSKKDAKKYFPWVPQCMVDTKARDLGVPTVCVIYMIFNYPVAWYLHLIAFILLFVSLTTYWDTLFGFDNFWFAGFVCGLAYFPYAIATGCWVAFIVRSLLLAVIWGGLNWFVNKYKIPYRDWIEELFRGLTLTITLLMLGGL